MKKIILTIVILMVLFLVNCSTPILYNKFNCEKSKTEITNEIDKIFKDKGFISSKVSGYDIFFKQQYANLSDDIFPSMAYKVSWKFIINKNEIIAYPEIMNMSNNETWILGNKSDNRYKEYNDIRILLEKICGNKVSIIKQKVN